MTCPERQRWLRNHTYVEFKDYHRPFLFPLEFISLAIILVLSVFFNFAIIITILRVKSLRQRLGNILIINLCVMDLITSFGSMLFSLIDIFYEGYFLCMDVFCLIQGGLAVVACFGNFAAITAITIHRFLSVFAKDKVHLTFKHVLVLIVGCWIFTLGVVIPPIGGNAKSIYKHSTHHCSPLWSSPYRIAVASVIYFATLIAMVLCYSIIYWKVKSIRNGLKLHKQKLERVQESAGDDEQNTSTVKKEDIAMQSEAQIDCFHRDDSSQLDSGFSATVINYPKTDNQETSDQRSVVEMSGPYQSKSNYERPCKGKKRANRNHDVDIRIAFAGVLLVVTTAVCWIPHMVINSGILHKEISHALSTFAMWTAYSNSVLDPVIYSVLNKDLQLAILNEIRLLRRFLRRNICHIY